MYINQNIYKYNIHSHAILLSKLDKAIPKAWMGEKGHVKSRENESPPNLPNCNLILFSALN